MGNDGDIGPERVQIDRARGNPVEICCAFGEDTTKECKRQRTLRLGLADLKDILCWNTFPLPVRPTEIHE